MTDREPQGAAPARNSTPALDRLVASRYFIVLVERSNRYRIAGAWSGPREEDDRRGDDQFERLNARVHNESVRVKVI